MVTSIDSVYKLDKQSWNLNSVLSSAVAIQCGWLFRFKWIKVKVKLNFHSSVSLAHYKHSVAIHSYYIAQHRSRAITSSIGQCWTRLQLQRLYFCHSLDFILPSPSIPLLIHPFSKCLSNTYYMPATMVNTGEFSHSAIVKGKCNGHKRAF